MDRLVFKLLSVLINSAFCGLLVMFVALDLKAEGATDDTDLGKVCCACQHSHERDIMAKAHCMDMMRVLKRDYNCTGDLGLFYYYDKDGRSYCPDISSDIAREKCDTLYMYSTHHGNSGFLESYFRQIRKCLAISWDKPDGSTGRLRDLKYQVLSCSVGNVSTDRLMEMAKEYVREQLQATCQIDPKRSVYLMVFTRNVWVVTGGGSVCWSNPTGLGEDSQLSITGGIHMTCNYIVRGCKEVHRGPCTKSLHCGVADNPRLTAECPCTNGRLNCPDWSLVGKKPPRPKNPPNPPNPQPPQIPQTPDPHSTPDTPAPKVTPTVPPVTPEATPPPQRPYYTPVGTLTPPSLPQTLLAASAENGAPWWAGNVSAEGDTDLPKLRNDELSKNMTYTRCNRKVKVRWVKNGFKIRSKRRVRRKCGLP